MLLPLGTMTVPEVTPVVVPSTAITVTVPPLIVTAASRQNGFCRGAVEAGMLGAVLAPGLEDGFVEMTLMRPPPLTRGASSLLRAMWMVPVSMLSGSCRFQVVLVSVCMDMMSSGKEPVEPPPKTCM